MPTGSALPDSFNERAAGSQVPNGPAGTDAAPGFEALPEGIAETDPVGPDDWYDVGSDESAGSSDADLAAAEQFAAFNAWDSTQNRIIAAIALILLVLAAIAGAIWRRRRESLVQSAPNTALASGIRRSMTGQMPSTLRDAPDWSPEKNKPKKSPKPEPEPRNKPKSEPKMDAATLDASKAQPLVTPDPAPEPEPVPGPPPAPVIPDSPTTPARIDLDLEVLGATRSLMMFTVEFRLDLANRSDLAVRDLNISAKLASAQRGTSNAAPLAAGQPIAAVERIGPQQSHRVTGTLQLPLAEVTPIRQGTKPLLIPLLHITLEGNGQTAMNQTFVLGTPSANGTGRVHPLPLDGPPGGLPPLRAQLVGMTEQGTAPSTQPA